jgi:nitrogen regulatory protein PII
MYFVLLVLNDVEKLEEILDAWDDAGVNGVTILPSTGMARHRESSALRDDLPLIPSLADLQVHLEATNRTLFTIVNDEDIVDKVIAATESVTGDLNLPHTGILVALPVLKSKGLERLSD